MSSRARASSRRSGVLGALLGLLFLLAGAAPANAQTILVVLLFGDKVASDHLYLSMKLGTNWTTLSGAEGASGMWGFNYGIQLDARLGSQKWWLIFELAPLSPKGGYSTGPVPAYALGNPELDDVLSRTTKTKLEFNSLDLPVLLSFRPTNKFRFGAGPFVSYRLNTATSSFYTSAPPLSDQVVVNVNSSPYYQRWDYGVALEAGYSPWGAGRRGRPTFSARYMIGLADLLIDNPGSAISNRVLQFSASFPYTKRPDEDKILDEYEKAAEQADQ